MAKRKMAAMEWCWNCGFFGGSSKCGICSLGKIRQDVIVDDDAEICHGDMVVCDLDGMLYEVIANEDRNKATPLPGVKLIGNVLTLMDSVGNRTTAFTWEVTKVLERA